jgi:ABC-type uncharacterized transport system substrate-binding protein
LKPLIGCKGWVIGIFPRSIVRIIHGAQPEVIETLKINNSIQPRISMKTAFAFLIVIMFSVLSVAQTTAQDPPKIAIIGYLSGGGAAEPYAKLFLQALEELGYVDGKNLRFEYRSAKGKRERLPELAAELIALKPAVIVPSGPTAAGPILKATQTIPVVMPNASADPVKAQFVKSLSEPGGNATGVAIGMRGLGSKRMELLKEALPSVQNVIFLNPHRQPMYLDEYQRAANALGLKLEVANVRSSGDIEEFFASLATKKTDALLI